MALQSHEIITHTPTHLFVGSPVHTQLHVIALLQKILCAHNGCSYCITCRGVYEKSSAHLLWLEPENNYTRDMLQPVFEALTLQRDGSDPFFIVMTHAERLQQSTANALLKSLEEPPAGYYFLLTTAHEKLVLPTIRSRCILHTVTTDAAITASENPLFMHCTGKQSLNPSIFLQTLDRLDLSEQDSNELLDMIINELCTMITHQKTAPCFANTDLKTLVACYTDAAALPPQSGSSKLFWKNIYIQTLTYHKTMF